jgi:nucleoside-diphosphate-sugar epimerase
VEKIYWPSSIGVFGPDSPKENAPQFTTMNPTTVYGISKLAGERWCAYYYEKFGVDVRSIRYPGLISYSSPPGGGTTDYAVEIFHEVLGKGSYQCFLDENTRLPMMYMPDAIRATIALMQAERSTLRVKSSYNLAGFSTTPAELANEIKKHVAMQIQYEPDFRQQIANSWPASIEDSYARQDWGWRPEYDLASMTRDMIDHLKR